MLGHHRHASETPSSVRQRNAIKMAFRWRADDGPLLLVFGSPHQQKEIKKQTKKLKVGPPLKNLSESAHGDTHK